MSTEEECRLLETINRLNETIVDLKAAQLREAIDGLSALSREHGVAIGLQTEAIRDLGGRVGALERSDIARGERERIENATDPAAQVVASLFRTPMAKGVAGGGVGVAVIVWVIYWLLTGHPIPQIQNTQATPPPSEAPSQE